MNFGGLSAIRSLTRAAISLTAAATLASLAGACAPRSASGVTWNHHTMLRAGGESGRYLEPVAASSELTSKALSADVHYARISLRRARLLGVPAACATGHAAFVLEVAGVNKGAAAIPIVTEPYACKDGVVEMTGVDSALETFPFRGGELEFTLRAYAVPPKLTKKMQARFAQVGDSLRHVNPRNKESVAAAMAVVDELGKGRIAWSYKFSLYGKDKAKKDDAKQPLFAGPVALVFQAEGKTKPSEPVTRLGLRLGDKNVVEEASKNAPFTQLPYIVLDIERVMRLPAKETAQGQNVERIEKLLAKPEKDGREMAMKELETARGALENDPWQTTGQKKIEARLLDILRLRIEVAAAERDAKLRSAKTKELVVLVDQVLKENLPDLTEQEVKTLRFQKSEGEIAR